MSSGARGSEPATGAVAGTGNAGTPRTKGQAMTDEELAERLRADFPTMPDAVLAACIAARWHSTSSATKLPRGGDPRRTRLSDRLPAWRCERPGDEHLRGCQHWQRDQYDGLDKWEIMKVTGTTKTRPLGFWPSTKTAGADAARLTTAGASPNWPTRWMPPCTCRL